MGWCTGGICTSPMFLQKTIVDQLNRVIIRSESRKDHRKADLSSVSSKGYITET